MDKISRETPDLTQENIAKIAALFPDVIPRRRTPTVTSDSPSTSTRCAMTSPARSLTARASATSSPGPVSARPSSRLVVP